MKKRFASVTAAALLLSSFVVGCSPAKPDSTTSDKSAPTSSASNQASQATTYPIATDQKLSYWAIIQGNIVGVKSSLDEVPFFQDWQKKTGVPLKYTTAPNNGSDQQFNVMLASGDLPDMIEYNWTNGYPGGPEKAIKDGYILKLNDLIDKHAPNLKKYLKEHPDVDKMVKTDNGSYYIFPFIRGDSYLQVFHGPIVRKDWLDELGFPVPTTIDEWYTTLKAFKEKKGASAPISFVGQPNPLNDTVTGDFVGAFGVTKGFYLDNGKVEEVK